MTAGSTLQAASIGAIAAAVLDQGGEAEVIAAFERSAYVMLERGIVCLGAPALGRGPIHLLVEARGTVRGAHFLGLTVGTKGLAGRRQLTLGADVVIPTQGAPVWSPRPFPTPPDVPAMKRGVAQVTSAMASQPAPDGLSALVFAPENKAARTRTALAARDLLAALRDGLSEALLKGGWPDPALRSATLLVGLGPGLTPSGDDLLGGLMLGLTARGATKLRDDLWSAIEGEVGELTVPASAMHLSAAADGMGVEAVHALIEAMLGGDGDATTAALGPVLALGASSGADAVAGIVVGLSA
jgi:hypothetical protein